MPVFMCLEAAAITPNTGMFKISLKNWEILQKLVWN